MIIILTMIVIFIVTVIFLPPAQARGGALGMTVGGGIYICGGYDGRLPIYYDI